MHYNLFGWIKLEPMKPKQPLFTSVEMFSTGGATGMAGDIPISFLQDRLCNDSKFEETRPK